MFQVLYSLFRRRTRVYCQSCGEEIEEGGYVTSNGEIYCISDMKDCFLASIKGNLKINYETQKEVEEDIKNGKLIHFGKLEIVLKG